MDQMLIDGLVETLNRRYILAAVLNTARESVRWAANVPAGTSPLTSGHSQCPLSRRRRWEAHPATAPKGASRAPTSGLHTVAMIRVTSTAVHSGFG